MAEVLHQYVEQNTAQTTTSATYADVTGLVIDGGDLEASTQYLLVARAIYDCNSNLNKTYLKVETADDSSVATYTEAIVEFANLTAGYGFDYLAVKKFTTAATPTDVSIQFKVDGSSTMTVDQASLMLLDLDDLGSENWLYDELFSTTELGGSRSARATIDGADLGQDEEWFLLGMAHIDVSSTAYHYTADMRSAIDAASDSTMQYVRHEGEDSAEQRIHGMVGRHNAVGADVDASIGGFEEHANANHAMDYSTLIALKASAFADYEAVVVQYDNVTGGVETTVATVGPYTPTVNGNHLIIGAGRQTVGNSNTSWHLEDGTTPTRSGDLDYTVTQHWDIAKDLNTGNVTERISISAEKTYNLRVLISASESVYQVGLHVLNLNLAAGGADAITPVAVTVTATPGSMVATVGSVAITPSATTVTVTPSVAVVTAGSVAVTPTGPTVTVTPSAVALTTGSVAITPDAVTVTATPGTAVLALSPYPIVPSDVTVTVTPNTLVVTPGAASIVPAATTVTVTPSSLSVAAGSVGVSPGGASVTVSPSAVVITATYPIALTGPTVTVTPNTTVLTSGSVGISLTGVSVTATPSTVVVTKGAAPIAITGPSVTATPGTVTATYSNAISLTGPTVTVTPAGLVVVQGQSVAPSDTTVTVSPSLLTITPGSVGITPTAISVTVAAGVVVVTQGSAVDKVEAALYHDEVLFLFLSENHVGEFTSVEVVGALNDINGTTGKEYWEARDTYLNA